MKYKLVKIYLDELTFEVDKFDADGNPYMVTYLHPINLCVFYGDIHPDNLKNKLGQYFTFKLNYKNEIEEIHDHPEDEKLEKEVGKKR